MRTKLLVAVLLVLSSIPGGPAVAADPDVKVNVIFRAFPVGNSTPQGYLVVGACTAVADNGGQATTIAAIVSLECSVDDGEPTASRVTVVMPGTASVAPDPAVAFGPVTACATAVATFVRNFTEIYTTPVRRVCVLVAP